MTGTYLGLVPARGGSKGVPRKNVRDLDGKPLIAYTIEAARKAPAIDRTVVTTDDDEIRETALEYGAETPFRRPADLATDDAPMEPVIEHALGYLAGEEGYEPDDVVLLQPTSPLRNAGDVQAAIERYEDADASSLVAVVPDHSNRWRRTPDGPRQLNYENETLRQDKQPEFVETGAIYISDAAAFLETGTLRIGQTTLYEMDRPSAVDIDTPFEFWLAERIMADWPEDGGIDAR